jgi:hypothetical protein
VRNANPRTPVVRRPNRLNRCAIYTRVSVESKDGVSSCDVQFDLCSAYIRSRRSLGYELIEEKFCDEGIPAQRWKGRPYIGC